MFRKILSLRKSQWLDESVVRDAIRAGSYRTFKKAGGLYCLSLDKRYAILVREHAAWSVTDTDVPQWHYGNFPPKSGEAGRALINVFKVSAPDSSGYWYKLFVPQDVRVTGLSAGSHETPHLLLSTQSGTHTLPFSELDAFKWTAMTGYAQSEKDIIDKFNQFVDLEHS